jgi:pyrimidine deaminase RibD-like protein
MTSNILDDIYYLMHSIDTAISGLLIMGTAYGSQVGCVLVDSDGRIISRAHNSPVDGRRMHAEELVLAGVRGRDLTSSVLYLTMEPCNGNMYHARRHCCQQIADSGIRRVVVGSPKGSNQGGITYLQHHGVSVDVLQNLRINRLCMMLTANSAPGDRISERVLKMIVGMREEMPYVVGQ